MTSPDSPTSFPFDEPTFSLPGRRADEHIELPPSVEGWVAVLALWPVINEPAYRLVANRFAWRRVPDWAFFSSLVARAGMIEPADGPGAFSFKEEWLPLLERYAKLLGGVEALKSQLMDDWLATPERDLMAPIASWARDAGRWDVFEQIWLLLGENTTGMSQEVRQLIQDLPAAARRARPILTWASAAAASLTHGVSSQVNQVVLDRLLLDSATLHADWALRQDTDAAVSGGTFRMIGQRRLPTAHPGQAVAAAWRTKEEIDDFIDSRSRAGQAPGRTSHAIFRAFSARLALVRFDTVSAINEARWAAVLADWEPVRVLAKGIEALALSFSGDENPAHHSQPAVVGIDDSLGFRGLRGLGRIYEILADGNEALRRLDVEGVDRCLSLVAPEAAGLAGVWAVRVSLAAGRATLWGDVNEGLKELSSDVLRLIPFGREQDEPFGGALLNRTRVLMLTKAGAFAAATQLAELMPEPLKLASLARIYLWSGSYRAALQIISAGPHQAGSDLVERYRLKLIRESATLLEGSSDHGARSEALSEMRRLLGAHAFSHIALLPKPARDVLLELWESEFDEPDPAYTLLLQRLRTLNDSDKQVARPVRLTARERVLLPLLATDEAVPEIARKLHVSVNTLRKQVATLREKFGAESRAELVRKATEYGAIP